MKSTVTAPANIAFIKYWGKKDDALRLPLNPSLSMNLSGALTTTTVEFLPDLKTDSVYYLENNQESGFDESEIKKVSRHLDRIREIAKSSLFAKVVTSNTFPKCSGVASSASGFAALTVAAATALNLNLNEKTLTTLARIGSGSACRSIPDGFVVWEEGDDNDSSFARSIFPESWWNLRDILCIVKSCTKKICSTDGMEHIITCPHIQTRLDQVKNRLDRALTSIQHKDFAALGDVMEEDCIDMHAVMMTQKPPLFYWTGVTMELIRAVHEWRNEGIPVYFTIDAGANVHLICEAENEKKVMDKLADFPGVVQTIVNHPSVGARITDKHLF
jgi:diphosphomevalonate decarboxylase